MALNLTGFVLTVLPNRIVVMVLIAHLGRRHYLFPSNNVPHTVQFVDEEVLREIFLPGSNGRLGCVCDVHRRVH